MGLAKQGMEWVAGVSAAIADLEHRVVALETGVVDPPPEPEQPEVVLGQIVYTKDEVDGWSTASSQYQRLLTCWAGKPDRQYDVPTAFPPHDSPEQEMTQDAAIYAAVQGVLYAVNGEQHHKDDGWRMLDQFALMTGWNGDGTDAALSAAWAAADVCKAAWLLEYPVEQLEDHLQMIFAHIDWPLGCNWHATQCQAALEIASLRGDMEQFEDSVDRFHFRITQSIFHPDFDDAVRPITNKGYWRLCETETSVSDSMTNQHWWNQNWKDPASLIRGHGGERVRDPSHEQMGLFSWIECARAIKACGGTVEAHAEARILDYTIDLSHRILHFAKTGGWLDPVPSKGAGGDMYKMGWYGVRHYLGDQCPADVHEMLTIGTFRDIAAAGALHIVADPFTNEA